MDVATVPTTQQRTAAPARAGSGPFRVGLLGTGYIADWHMKALAAVPGVEVVAVCDQSRLRGEGFARSWGIAGAFPTLEAMLAEARLDVVHVIVPPQVHVAVIRQILQAGVHVLTEKPMGTSPEDCRALAELARQRGLALGVGHNFLFSPAYEQLRADVRAGKLGRLDRITVTWSKELGFVTMGPFDTWMLQQTGNIMLEVGVHSVAHVLDLAGEPAEVAVRASLPRVMPTGVTFCRRWEAHGSTRDGAAIELEWNFRPGFPEQVVRVRGLLGTATADLEANTYTLDRTTPYSLDFDRYVRLRRNGKGLMRQGGAGLREYLLAKLKLNKRGNPFQTSIAASMQAFYAQLRDPAAMDSRLSGAFGASVVAVAERIGRLGAEPHRAAAPSAGGAPRAAPVEAGKVPPRVLVLGGNGFIGRELVRQLLAAGHAVRILVRNPGSVMLDRANPRLAVLAGDMRRREDVDRALDGIEVVYHLARGNAKLWSDWLSDDVEVTRQLGELCVQHKVKRLLYTGTIASLDTSAGAGTIRCDTPLDRGLSRRSYYVRAKGVGEQILLQQHREQGLGVVILRPAIVIGAGSSPCHWGVAMWNGVGVCQLWGDGTARLPLVLVEDVASALVKALDAPGIEGKSYNLSARASLTAREYLDELQRHAGMQLQVLAVPIWKYWLNDMLKWVVKVAVRHPDGKRVPTYHDWSCRTHAAPFDCSAAEQDLQWQPVSDRAEIIRRGIHEPLNELLG